MTVVDVRKIVQKIRKPPIRFGIACMLFLACFVSYMMRVNISINIIAMVEPRNENETAPDYGQRYPWTAQDQSYVLGSYFWGYMVTSLPAGVLAAIFGGRHVIGWSILGSAICTILTPYCALWSYWLLLVMRFMIGVFGGLLYPAAHHLVSQWAPPDEKGKFVSSLMGGTFGTVITWQLCGVLTEEVGYTWSYHATAIISIVVALIWFFVVADTPEKHTHITDSERDYIMDSLKGTVSKGKAMPPVLHLLRSLPFLSLLILHYGSMWGLYFLLTAAPKFMAEVLGFDIKEAGFLSSLPYLARLIMAFIFGLIGDAIRRRKLMPVTWMRKIFTIFSHIIPGLLLIAMAYFGREAALCVTLMTLSLGVNGAATLTNLANSQDLAPNYAGTLYGIINFVGTTPGFFSPMIVAYFTKEQNTIHEWTYIFLVGATAYIGAAIIFVIFGSGLVQYWNDLTKSGDIEKAVPEKDKAKDEPSKETN